MLKIGTLEIPAAEGHSWRQTFAEIGTSQPFRTRSGSLLASQRYRKLRSNIRGEGWDVSGLEGLNPATAYALHCIQPRALVGASNVLTIPASYRTDAGYTAQGSALVGGRWQASPVGLVGQVATVTTVSGATAYRVKYWPVLTGFIVVNIDYDDVAELFNINIEFTEQ